MINVYIYMKSRSSCKQAALLHHHVSAVAWKHESGRGFRHRIVDIAADMTPKSHQRVLCVSAVEKVRRASDTVIQHRKDHVGWDGMGNKIKHLVYIKNTMKLIKNK